MAAIAARRGTHPATLRELLAGDLNWIVKKALEKSPQRRYASPSEFASDIERHLKGERVLAGPPRRARNCAAGDVVDEEQARASGKNDVSNQLRRLTARLASKSASSMAVLQKNAAPLEPATTSSLEALKSFSAAMRLQVHASEPDAIP